MPRKRRKQPEEPMAVAEPLEAVKVALDQGKSWTHSVRPDGPRPRDGEPAATYTGKDVRVSTDGQTWQVEVRKELNAEEFDRLQRSGFEPVDDACQVWNASSRAVREAGTDVNILAVMLDGKGERLGRVR